MKEQRGDDTNVPFSFTNTEEIKREQISCWITYTNEKPHNTIRSNIDRFPLFSTVGKVAQSRFLCYNIGMGT